jgi:hypothetical protein
MLIVIMMCILITSVFAGFCLLSVVILSVNMLSGFTLSVVIVSVVVHCKAEGPTLNIVETIVYP